MDRAAHAMITSGVTTVFHPLVYAKTLIQVRSIIEISAYEESHLLLVTCYLLYRRAEKFGEL